MKILGNLFKVYNSNCNRLDEAERTGKPVAIFFNRFVILRGPAAGAYLKSQQFQGLDKAAALQKSYTAAAAHIDKLNAHINNTQFTVDHISDD